MDYRDSTIDSLGRWVNSLTTQHEKEELWEEDYNLLETLGNMLGSLSVGDYDVPHVDGFLKDAGFGRTP